MKAIHRIVQAFEDGGKKPAAVEKELGLSNGYIATMRKRDGNLGEDVLLKFASYLDYNLQWLLTGEGDMLRSSLPKAMEVSSGGIPLIDALAVAGLSGGMAVVHEGDVL
ncbi:MAG: helix-turn-helix domain-containing protein, partial [Gammaproteobacteria bacterium]|nr:helix-turn-helix domain-containing protein [Gammaproteobacteria bacterium]